MTARIMTPKEQNAEKRLSKLLGLVNQPDAFISYAKQNFTKKEISKIYNALLIDQAKHKHTTV